MAVFHVDQRIHKLVQQYCKNNGFQIKQWVIAALEKAMYDGVGYVEGNMKINPSKKMRLDKVVQKQLVDNTPAPSDDDLWFKPPFWAKN